MRYQQLAQFLASPQDPPPASPRRVLIPSEMFQDESQQQQWFPLPLRPSQQDWRNVFAPAREPGLASIPIAQSPSVPAPAPVIAPAPAAPFVASLSPYDTKPAQFDAPWQERPMGQPIASAPAPAPALSPGSVEAQYAALGPYPERPQAPPRPGMSTGQLVGAALSGLGDVVSARGGQRTDYTGRALALAKQAQDERYQDALQEAMRRWQGEVIGRQEQLGLIPARQRAQEMQAAAGYRESEAQERAKQREWERQQVEGMRGAQIEREAAARNPALMEQLHRTMLLQLSSEDERDAYMQQKMGEIAAAGLPPDEAMARIGALQQARATFPRERGFFGGEGTLGLGREISLNPFEWGPIQLFSPAGSFLPGQLGGGSRAEHVQRQQRETQEYLRDLEMARRAHKRPGPAVIPPRR